VRIGHFETIKPICPVCRAERSRAIPLKLAHVEREQEGHVVEGFLNCSADGCLREYPIIDGIPIIVPDVRSYVAGSVLALYGRGDFSEAMESLIGDCCGPGSQFDVQRQHLSSYAWDHFGQFDPAESDGDYQPGSVLRLLESGLNLSERKPGGPAIDIGCSVGGATFSLAGHCDNLVLGVDFDFSMLQLASAVLRTGRVCYPRRRVGLAYDRREFAVDLEHRERVDFWACDATSLPFADKTFETAVALNVVDSVYSPVEVLTSVDRILAAGGNGLFACPYDWSAGATAVESWMGGHSQRGAERGDSATILRKLLTAGAHPDSLQRLRILAEADELDWHVRVHDRGVMHYKTHAVLVEAL